MDDIQDLDRTFRFDESVEEQISTEPLNGYTTQAGEVRVLKEAWAFASWEAPYLQKGMIDRALPAVSKPLVSDSSVIVRLVKDGRCGCVTYIYVDQAARL